MGKERTSKIEAGLAVTLFASCENSVLDDLEHVTVSKRLRNSRVKTLPATPLEHGSSRLLQSSGC